MERLRYRDDRDRAYGAAGMAIGLVVCDGEAFLSGVSLDNADADILELSTGWDSPVANSASAREAWHAMVNHYHLATAMTLGNVLCRRYVMEGETMLDPSLREALRSLAADEAQAACSLERDEAEAVFNKDLNYLSQAFRHNGVQHLAHELAALIHSNRSLSRGEILELLSSLALL